MAEVRMDLAELDKIKNEVVIQKANVLKKEEELVKLQLTLKEVEANKRIVSKTVIKRPDQTGTIYIDSDKVDKLCKYYSRSGKSLDLAEIIKDSVATSPSTYDTFTFRHGNLIAINAYVSGTKDEESTEYINFEDVQFDLKKRAEDQVAKELGTLRDKAQEMEARISQIRANNKEALALVDTEHNKKLVKLKENLDNLLEEKKKDLEKLNKDFQDLKEDRDTRSTETKLQEEIEKLKEELQKEKSKSWWSKLFS